MPDVTSDQPLAVIEPVIGTPVGNGPRLEKGEVHVEPRFTIFEHGRLVIKAPDYPEAHMGLDQLEERHEKIVEINAFIDGYPLDIIVQFNVAMDEVYGFSHAVDRRGFFGTRMPPMKLSIATGPGPDDHVEVVFGEMAPPAWEGGKIGMYVDTSKPLRLQIKGTVKQKFEGKVNEIIKRTRELVKTHSIYAGKAVKLDLDYIETGEFDPMQCAPTFMEIEEVNLILNEVVERQLTTYLWNVIRNPHKFRRGGVPIKTGILLGGAHGSGKTLTSTYTAGVAVKSGMTYLYLEKNITDKTFLAGYNLAKILSQDRGCVFFLEDCDQLFGGERDAKMNTLFELLDGIDSKSKKGAEVIMVYTTNYLERLHPGFLRSGRVDRVVVMGPPDAKAAWQFVQRNLGIYLGEGIDDKAVGEAYAGMVQSDIDSACTSAKMYRIGDSHDDDSIEGKIDTNDLLLAAEEINVKNGLSKKPEDPNAVALQKLQSGMEVVLGSYATDITVTKGKTTKLEEDLKKVAKGVGVALK